MTAHETGDTGDAIPPDDAFAALGNGTRIQILQTLNEADEALSFSDLRHLVGVDDPGQFNYHLNKLRNHFIRQTEDGYELREPGSIVVQAVLSGAVTQAPVLEPTRLDASCPYCASPIEMRFSDERIIARCTECTGTYSGSESDVRFLEAHPHGTIAVYTLPPAGLEERTPRRVLEAALARTHVELLAMAMDVCPRCSAAVIQSLRVCESHDGDDGICEKCDRRLMFHVDYRCTNCSRIDENIPAWIHLVPAPELMSFLSAHGINPVVPSWEDLAVLYNYEERRETDPFGAELTYTIDGDALTLTVDADLTVVDATEHGGSESV